MADESSTATPGTPRAHPVRLVVADDLERRRLTVLFRAILVIPHLIWLGLWSIAAFLAAFANWIAALALGRPNTALHRFLSLFVKYATHVYGYLLLGANPYPPFDGRPGYPIDVEIDPPGPQPRLGVAFRLVLAIPILLVLASLFGFPQYRSSGSGVYFDYGSGLAHTAAVLGWFACLAVGRMPRGLRDCVAWGVGFGAQVWAYLLVLTSAYPDCDPEVVLGELVTREDPVTLSAGGELRRSRLTVLFRLPLTFPHLVWLALWSVLAFFAALATWLVTLVRAQPPAALHRFLAAYLRYQVHVYAFLSLAASPFPGFAGASGSYPVEPHIAPPDRQGRWGVAFRWLMVIPAGLLAASYGGLLWMCAFLGWFAALVTGRMPRRLLAAQTQALRYTAQTYGYLLLLTGAYPFGGPCDVSAARQQGPVATAFG